MASQKDAFVSVPQLLSRAEVAAAKPICAVCPAGKENTAAVPISQLFPMFVPSLSW